MTWWSSFFSNICWRDCLLQKLYSAFMEDNMEFPHKYESIFIIKYIPFLLGICPKGIKSAWEKIVCILVFKKKLISQWKLCCQPRCPLNDHWSAVEYYSPVKQNKILYYVNKLMHVWTIIASEISQSPPNKYHMLFHWMRYN